jgi:hypothetical protein
MLRGDSHGDSLATIFAVNLRVLLSRSFRSMAGRASFAACFCAFIGSSLSGQEFRIGFVGGAPITSNFAPSSSVYPGDAVNPPSDWKAVSGPRCFIAGMSLEALISSRFSIEGNVLHRDLWAKQIYTLNPGTPAASTTTNQFIASTTWEFPVLFKYTMGGNRWRPFVEGGVSFRSLERTGAPGPSRHGFTGGAGVAIELGRIQLAPQFRYTRWAESQTNGYYMVKPDQLELLTGIGYRFPTVAHVGDQRIAVGVLGGARLNETLAGVPNRLNRRAFGGLSLDVNLRDRLSIGADAIYEPIGVSGNSVLTWGFPVLLKYHWRVLGARLFSEVGPSFRASGNLQGSIPPSHFGFTAGAGVEKRSGRIGIAPALRYTRWSEGQGYRGSSGSTIYDPNSVELVVGVSF